MNFRQAAILFSLGLGLAEGKKSKGTKKSPKSCITAADAMVTINAFAGAVPAVQRAKNSPGGCQAAYTAATGALDVAYGYNLGLVLFKPTLTSEPYTFRNDYNAALSYFVGTDCLVEVGQRFFPEGNNQGAMFREKGFGTDFGYSSATVSDFEFLVDGYYCDSPLAVGQICFHADNGSNACVDKTFSFARGGENQNAAVITSHHSSQVVTSGLTECQNLPAGFQPFALPLQGGSATSCP